METEAGRRWSGVAALCWWFRGWYFWWVGGISGSVRTALIPLLGLSGLSLGFSGDRLLLNGSLGPLYVLSYSFLAPLVAFVSSAVARLLGLDLLWLWWQVGLGLGMGFIGQLYRTIVLASCCCLLLLAHTYSGGGGFLVGGWGGWAKDGGTGGRRHDAVEVSGGLSTSPVIVGGLA